MTVLSLFRPARPVPAEHRANFFHLYLDIAWYGILSGSAISFLAVFATRQGADALQIGLLSAAPAIVNLIFTLPAGHWLQHRPINRTVFWTAVWQRLFYLPWLFLPLFLAPQGQIWTLLTLILLMSIPGTALAVGFNALFAATVPPEWRGHVAGIRNALLSLVFVLTSLLCGFILDVLPFPLGYQVVFGIGFIGAVMSTYHLWYIRTRPEDEYRPRAGRSLGDLARPGLMRPWGDGWRTAVGLRFLTRGQGRPLLQLNVLSSPFGRIILLLFAFHLSQYLAIPLFPLYWVNQLHLTDQEISLGTAVFYLAVLLGSTQLARLTHRLGHKRLLAIGILGMSLYPALTAATWELGLFLITSVVGGLAWSLVGGAASNYILERIPEDKRPAYLAWYNLALNAAVLLGSLGGPLVADSLGLAITLVMAAVSRLLAGLALWRWG
jgi:MFS family permease